MITQRLLDLVRYARVYLHDANLISDEEYAWLVENSNGSVDRLESYDEVQKKLKSSVPVSRHRIGQWLEWARSISNENHPACEALDLLIQDIEHSISKSGSIPA